jgi:HAD superfamily hydrolase (TIGR01509 family)
MVGTNVPTTMRLLFADVGIDPTPEDLVDGAAWISRRTEEVFRAGLPWRPGAQEALRAVRSSGVPMALVTSTERSLTEVALDTIGRDLFDVTVCGDEVAATKPAPDPYLGAAAQLGLPPWQCVAVEDSPTGAASASAAGCAVLVVPSEVPVPPAPGLTRRDSLVGLTAAELHAVWTRSRVSTPRGREQPDATNHWSTHTVRSAAHPADQ